MSAARGGRWGALEVQGADALGANFDLREWEPALISPLLPHPDRLSQELPTVGKWNRENSSQLFLVQSCGLLIMEIFRLLFKDKISWIVYRVVILLYSRREGGFQLILF